MYLLETSVAIDIREEGGTLKQVGLLSGSLLLSIFTRIELEGGVHADSELAEFRARRTEAMLRAIETLPFDLGVIADYGRIVSVLGFSRRQMLDRLIAATAIVHDLTLITINAADFRNIPGLRLEVWPAQ